MSWPAGLTWGAYGGAAFCLPPGFSERRDRTQRDEAGGQAVDAEVEQLGAAERTHTDHLGELLNEREAQRSEDSGDGAEAEHRERGARSVAGGMRQHVKNLRVRASFQPGAVGLRHGEANPQGAERDRQAPREEEGALHLGTVVGAGTGSGRCTRFAPAWHGDRRDANPAISS